MDFRCHSLSLWYQSKSVDKETTDFVIGTMMGDDVMITILDVMMRVHRWHFYIIMAAAIIFYIVRPWLLLVTIWKVDPRSSILPFPVSRFLFPVSGPSIGRSTDPHAGVSNNLCSYQLEQQQYNVRSPWQWGWTTTALSVLPRYTAYFRLYRSSPRIQRRNGVTSSCIGRVPSFEPRTDPTVPRRWPCYASYKDANEERISKE